MKAGRDASAARGAVFGRWAKDFGLGEREMMLRGEIGLSRIAKLSFVYMLAAPCSQNATEPS